MSDVVHVKTMVLDTLEGVSIPELESAVKQVFKVPGVTCVCIHFASTRGNYDTFVSQAHTDGSKPEEFFEYLYTPFS